MEADVTAPISESDWNWLNLVGDMVPPRDPDDDNEDDDEEDDSEDDDDDEPAVIREPDKDE